MCDLLEAETIIELSNITKKYGSGAAAVRALDGISLSVKYGEFLAVCGPSGAGKSALLRLIGCLEAPCAGTYLFDGTDPMLLTDRERAFLRNRKISVIRPSDNLLPELTIEENVALPLRYAGLSKEKRKMQVREALEALSLYGKRGRYPAEVTPLQRQKSALAMALACDRKLILADEPTGMLGAADAEELLAILRGLWQEGRTVLLATHDRQNAACAERFVFLKDGVLTPAEDGKGWVGR